MIKVSQKWAKRLANLDPARFQVRGGFFGSNCDLMKGNLDCCEAITDMQMDRQTGRWTGRQADRQTDGHFRVLPQFFLFVANIFP